MATLGRWQASILDSAGNVVPGATVTVREEEPGAALVQLYSDRAGLTAIGNPITADADGFVAFHAPGQAVRIDAVSGSFSRTWRYVGVGTANEGDFDTMVEAAVDAAEAAIASGFVTSADYGDHTGAFSTFEDYGATGGSDDTTAVAAAVAAGGTIIAKPGRTYIITSTITLAAGTTIIGYGAAIKLKNSASYTTGGLIDMRNGRCSLIGLEVDGNRANNAFNQNALGIYLGGFSGDAPDNRVVDCYIHNMTGYGIFGYGGAIRPKILRNRIVDVPVVSIMIYPSSANTPTRAQIIGNQITEIGRHAIVVQDSDDPIVADNYIEGTLVAGMVVNVSGTAVTWVSGPTFADIKPQHFLFLDGGTEILISAVGSTTSLTLASSGGTLSNKPAAAGSGDLLGVNSCARPIIRNNIIRGGVSLGISYGNGFNGATGKGIGGLIQGNVCVGQGCAGISLQTSGSPGNAGTAILGNIVQNSGKAGTAGAAISLPGIIVVGATNTDVFIDGNVVFDDGTVSPAMPYWLYSSASAGEVRVGSNDVWGTTNAGVSGTAVVSSQQGVGEMETAPATAIAAIGNAINTTGKRLGKQVWDSTNHRIMVAAGGATSSLWYVADGSASVTPA